MPPPTGHQRLDPWPWHCAAVPADLWGQSPACPSECQRHCDESWSPGWHGAPANPRRRTGRNYRRASQTYPCSAGAEQLAGKERNTDRMKGRLCKRNQQGQKKKPFLSPAVTQSAVVHTLLRLERNSWPRKITLMRENAKRREDVAVQSIKQILISLDLQSVCDGRCLCQQRLSLLCGTADEAVKRITLLQWLSEVRFSNMTQCRPTGSTSSVYRIKRLTLSCWAPWHTGPARLFWDGWKRQILFIDKSWRKLHHLYTIGWPHWEVAQRK